MKKSIVLFNVLIPIFAIMAFGVIKSNKTVENQITNACGEKVYYDFDFLNLSGNKSAPEFFYEVDSRFIANISKENLHNAKSIIDIFPVDATKSMVSFTNTKISLLDKDGETSELGNGELLNDAQLSLLQSTEYSTNFYITANCKQKINENGDLDDYNLVYYFTVIPETEAEFINGHEALMDFLKENSKAEVASIDKTQLQPGKLRFTVSKEGKVEQVNLESTSGFTCIDEKMIQLIKRLPGAWQPATNSKGEKVDQELVFSFGNIGC